MLGAVPLAFFASCSSYVPNAIAKGPDNILYMWDYSDDGFLRCEHTGSELLCNKYLYMKIEDDGDTNPEGYFKEIVEKERD